MPADITKIALANIDVDMYDATLAGLRKVAPLIEPRGIIICEDPASTPGLYGAFVAMEEFLASEVGKEIRARLSEDAVFPDPHRRLNCRRDFHLFPGPAPA